MIEITKKIEKNIAEVIEEKPIVEEVTEDTSISTEAPEEEVIEIAESSFAKATEDKEEKIEEVIEETSIPTEVPEEEIIEIAEKIEAKIEKTPSGESGVDRTTQEVTDGSFDTVESPSDNFSVFVGKKTATYELICKKWLLIKMVIGEEKNAFNLSQSSLKGSFYIFDNKGKSSLKLMTVEGKGKWEFGSENKSIVILNSGSKKVWLINEITESNLVLLRENSEEKWYFIAQ